MIYTIGHSNHDLDTFLGLLEAAGIQMLADGSHEPHAATQQRLLERAGLAQRGLFDDESQRLDLAYEYAARR